MLQNITSKKQNINLSIWSVLRVVLGLILIWKGVNIISDTFIWDNNTAVVIMLTASLMVIGGGFIVAGIRPGIISFLLLPILMAGILFIHAGHLERNGFERFLTAIVPFLMLAFITRADTKQIHHT